MNAWVEQYLRVWMTGRQNDWARQLPIAEFAHNSWRHDIIRHSPHKLLLGFKPQANVKFLLEDILSSTKRIKKLQETRQEMQKLLETLQQRKDMQKIMEMNAGDQVWLEGKNLMV